MLQNKKSGRSSGLFLLTMIIIGIPAVSLRGIRDILENPAILATVYESSYSMKISIVLSFASAIAGLFFSIKAFQVLKNSSGFAAVSFLSLWIFQMIVTMMGDVFHYALLEAAEFALQSGEGTSSLQPLSMFAIGGYTGAHEFALIIFCSSLALLNAYLLKFRLLPFWLTIWGILGNSAVFIATWFRMFDLNLSAHINNQHGLLMIVMAIYLIIKGFKENKAANVESS